MIEWSNSRLTKLQMCGERFRRSEIEGEPEAPTPSLIRGSTVHAVAKVALRRKLGGKPNTVLPTIEETRDLAATDFEQRWSAQEIRLVAGDEEDGADALAQAKANAKDFAVGLSGYHVTELAPRLRPVAVERKIIVKPRDSDLTIHGTLDVITQPEAGRWPGALVEVEETAPPDTIRDLKTSAKSPSRDAADKSQQLSMYSMIRAAEVGSLPERLALDYLVRTPKRAEMKAIELTTTRDDADIHALVARINTAVEAVKRGVFMPADPGSWWCLSLDTEILTRDGWKTYPMFSEADEVLTHNPYSFLLEWQRPQRIFRKTHHARMVRYEGKSLRFCVTPDHRMLVRSSGRGRYRVVPAEMIEGKASLAYVVAGYLPRPSVTLSDDEIALSGWLCAEGHFRADSAMIEIAQKSRTEGWRKIDALLRRLGLPYSIRASEDADLFRLHADGARHVRDRLNVSKALPRWLWDADGRQFRIWLSAFGDGDGHRTGYALEIRQKSEAFINELQALCVSQRMSATKGQGRRSSTSEALNWPLTIIDGITERIPQSAAPGHFIPGFKADEVWCVTVPNGFIVTRFEGRVLITGNCSEKACGFWTTCPYVRRSRRPTT